MSIKQYNCFGKQFGTYELNIPLTYNPEVPLLLELKMKDSFSFKKNENLCPHKYLYANVHSTLFVLAKIWWMDKHIVAYTFSGILVSEKMEETTDSCDNTVESFEC